MFSRPAGEHAETIGHGFARSDLWHRFKGNRLLLKVVLHHSRPGGSQSYQRHAVRQCGPEQQRFLGHCGIVGHADFVSQFLPQADRIPQVGDFENQFRRIGRCASGRVNLQTSLTFRTGTLLARHRNPIARTFRYLFALGVDMSTILRGFYVYDIDPALEQRFQSLLGSGVSQRFMYQGLKFEDAIQKEISGWKDYMELGRRYLTIPQILHIQ